MSEPERNLWPALAGLLAVACCLGLPLLLAAGAGAAIYALAGLAATAAALVGAALILVTIRRRAAAARQAQVDSWRGDSGRVPLASSLKRKSG